METPQQSPALSTLLLSLLIFLFTSTTQVQSRIATNLQVHQACSSSCGDITSITYPFRLTTDPPGCGDSDYQLSCENNKPILEFHSGKYVVKQISYQRQIIRVADINLDDGTCKLPAKSLSIEEINSDTRYRGSGGFSNTYTSFVSCTSNLTSPIYREVPCLSGNGRSVYVAYNSYIISDLQGPCSFISRVPTIFQAVKDPSYQSILQLNQAGFELGWSVECRDCSEHGGLCVLTSMDTPYVYECEYPGLGGIYVPRLVEVIIAIIWEILLVLNLIARFILAPIVIIGFLIHKYRTSKKEVDNQEKIQLIRQPFMPRRYSYTDIVTITNQFKDRLGQGGFGIVYKGQLPDGCFVAVKMLSNSTFSDEDFINEVSMLARIRHVNVVQLVGFCSEGSHRAVVLEYMPNGSLDKHLLLRESEHQPFSWEKLLEIALGTAMGIEHLHSGCDVCILHLDIKPHNVLLNHNFIPKLSDFGLAKLSKKECDFVSTSTIRGTMKYVAPELISRNLGTVSSKSDVYSFGILLLEIARRRRDINVKGNCSNEVYFPSWVYDHLNDGGDLGLENVTEIEATIARKLCVVGLWCIQKKASDRPSMSNVVQMLKGNISDLQLPPNSLSFPQYSSTKEPQSEISTELLISETVEESL